MTGAGLPRAEVAARWARVGFWAFLIVSWAVMAVHMWGALTTVPSAERLEETRLVAIPTPRTYFAAVVVSAIELMLVLAILWPWRPRYYVARLGFAALASWFAFTVPLHVSRMDWVHRRWLMFLILAVAGALVVTLTQRLARRLLGRPR